MKPVAIVTGGGRGIGRGIVFELVKAGYDCVVNYASNAASAEEVLQEAEKLGGRVALVQADISVPADRQKLFDETVRAFGTINLLVNNAGVAPEVRADILEASEESFDRLMRINLKGPYFLSQKVANYFVAEKKKNEAFQAAIVNISSISAYTSSWMRGDYCLSKAGIGMMTALFADRLSEFNINVYEIRPGIIMTDMTGPVKAKYDKLIAEGLLPLKRWGQPEDIGKAVTALASGAMPYSTGEVVNVDGGFHLRRL